jgi:N-ethylmaleimide reductase
MTLAEFRPVFKGTINANCGYTREAAEERIAEGNADIIAFGRLYITNPDLPERFKNGCPLNPAEDRSLWYTPSRVYRLYVMQFLNFTVFIYPQSISRKNRE